MSNYWYENQDILGPGDVCVLEDGTTVVLNYRVPGDGTDWIVSELNLGGLSWSNTNRRIHPSDIKKGPSW